MGLRTHKAADPTGSQSIRFLVARIGEPLFAFPADWVRGVVTLSEAGNGSTVAWAGSTYDHTDLAERLTRTTPKPGSESRIVLYGNDDRSRAFLVDQVVGLVDVIRHEIRPMPPHFRGAERERLIGFFMDPAYIALIANPYWVLELPSSKDVLGALGRQTTVKRAVPDLTLPQLAAVGTEQ